MLLATGVLSGLAAWSYHVRLAPGLIVAFLGAPLHLLLAATGSLSSPLLPVSAAWVASLAWLAPHTAVPAALLTLGVLPAIDWARAPAPDWWQVFGLGVLLGLSLLILPIRRRLAPRADRGPAEPARDPPVAPLEVDASDAVIKRALRFAAWACDADDVALWTLDVGAGVLRLRDHAELQAGEEPPSSIVPVEGHPFGWAVREGMHVRLERGRRDLPIAWAAEILLVPVCGSEGLLAFAYRDSAPQGVEAIALQAGLHLTESIALLRMRDAAQANQERVRALLSAARSVSGEVQMEGFADRLSGAVRKTTGAQGTAVALWSADQGRGEVVHISELSSPPVSIGTQFMASESRIGLAMKHGISLWFDDLSAEPERLPVCARGELWNSPPRSLHVVPLLVGGTTVGAVAAWHAEPGWFGEEEREYLELLGSVAPSSLESARRYEELYQRASTDALTGLPNRGAFEMRFAVVAAQFQRYGRPFAVILLDIDHFKQFNDRWGHEAGDRVLGHVGLIIRSTVRETDLPARFGGEEFVVLLPETPLREAVEAAERIRQAIASRSLDWNGRTLSVTASLGVASCPQCSGIPGDLVVLADTALYESKARGRNCVTAAPEAELAGR